MKQIKTIIGGIPEYFDDKVNAALADGWTLISRGCHPVGFMAELERDVITEAERACENCFHFGKSPDQEPCFSCSEDCDKWEAAW